MMSWFPRVERARHEPPWAYIKRSTDALLGALCVCAAPTLLAH
jgi:hypothetical protein